MPGLTQKSLTSLRLDTYFLKPVPHHITETHSNGAEKLQSSCQSYTTLISLPHYRPQRSCESYVFTGICLSEGGCLPQCMVGYTPQSRHPPGADPPPRNRQPSRSRHPAGSRHTSLGADTPPPRADTPPEQTHPQEQTPPWEQTTPPRDGHCCGRYASYWNAFLLYPSF